MSTLCIIPARGGSKGIPCKNVRTIAGKPLIAHSIEQANRAAQVDRVVVSTDDSEIADISKRYGAQIVWRPAEISGDDVSSESVLLHTIDYLERTENYQSELLVFLQCTAPLTLAEDIDGTVQSLLDENADTGLTVTTFHYFLWRRHENGNGVGINHDKQVRKHRQQQKPQFLETGAVYVMRTAGFKEARHRFFGKTALYVMPRERCLEIDEPVDLQVAEVLMQVRKAEKEHAISFDSIALLVLDFDGVLTDNRVLMDQDGKEAVYCNRSDGWGIAQLQEAGVEVMVLSTETNPAVTARCTKLGISCIQGCEDKLKSLKQLIHKRGLKAEQVVYVGNDVNDLDCMYWVGVPIAVADAAPEVRQVACLVTGRFGGRGAVREVCDLILLHKKGDT